MTDRIEKVARAICEATHGPGSSDERVPVPRGRDSVTERTLSEPRWHYYARHVAPQHIAAFDALREMEKT